MSARYEMVESSTSEHRHDDVHGAHGDGHGAHDDAHCVYQPDQAMSSLDGMHVFADGDGEVANAGVRECRQAFRCTPARWTPS